MSKVGYYRYKFVPPAPGVYTISFFKNGAKAAEHKVIVRDKCTNDRIVKYLDKDGQYRYFNFNENWTQSLSSKKIGSNNKIITDLLKDQGDSKSIGKKSDNQLNLRADITQDELDLIAPMFESPRVYLKIGNTDSLKDWLLVDAEVNDGTTRIGKGVGRPLSVTITLPQHYSITML